ncbi:Autophagy-related protein 9 like [Verticillium longisporum]|nr:Autophagy-related protein 9 like [Verticillium longisporum]
MYEARTVSKVDSIVANTHQSVVSAKSLPKKAWSSQLQSYSQREDEEEAGGPLGESVWQTSPAKNLSRESSGALSREPDTGVLGLIQQFQQAQRNNRLGGA